MWKFVTKILLYDYIISLYRNIILINNHITKIITTIIQKTPERFRNLQLNIFSLICGSDFY